MVSIHDIQLDPIVSRALEEDWGYGDWTTDLCVDEDRQAVATIICKEPTVVAGTDVVRSVFRHVDPSLTFREVTPNGDSVCAGTALVEVTGSARSLLKGERVALNFFSRMCGIASMTREFVHQIEGSKAQLLDTRKTTPGLRLLEKAATVIGGARNHRFGLCDGVIVKDNHIVAAGGISKAVGRLLDSLSPTLKVEVEVGSLEQVQEALDAGADLLMLDNMSVSEMALAVRTIRGRALVEASGNVTLVNAKQVAETGVDFISTSAILHSARWSDLSLGLTQV